MFYESEFDQNLWRRIEICTEAIREETTHSTDPEVLNNRYSSLRARAMDLGRNYAARLQSEKREWYGAKAKVLTELLRQTEELLTESPKNSLKLILNLGEISARIMGIEYELLAA